MLCDSVPFLGLAGVQSKWKKRRQGSSVREVGTRFLRLYFEPALSGIGWHIDLPKNFE